MLKVVVCDDECFWRETIQKDVRRWAADRNEAVSCFFVNDSAELGSFLADNPDTDVLFLDIEFADSLDGIKAAKQLRSAGNAVPIIFVSNHAIMASEGYMVDAIGFLVKEYAFDMLVFYLDKVLRLRKPAVEKVLIVDSERLQTHIPHKDIVYLESYQHDVMIHTKSNTVKTRRPLFKIFEELGSDDFVQIQKSFVVAVRLIVGIKVTYPYSIELKSGDETVLLTVGRTYISDVQQVYANSVKEGLL